MADTIPHLAFPLTLSGGTFATVDQDSDEEIVGCVQATLLCPVGHRDALPDFGVPELKFTPASTDRAGIVQRAVAVGEPRASRVLASEDYEHFVSTIGVQVKRG